MKKEGESRLDRVELSNSAMIFETDELRMMD